MVGLAILAFDFCGGCRDTTLYRNTITNTKSPRHGTHPRQVPGGWRHEDDRVAASDLVVGHLLPENAHLSVGGTVGAKKKEPI